MIELFLMRRRTRISKKALELLLSKRYDEYLEYQVPRVLAYIRSPMRDAEHIIFILKRIPGRLRVRTRIAFANAKTSVGFSAEQSYAVIVIKIYAFKNTLLRLKERLFTTEA